MAKALRDIEIENGGNAPRIHAMDDYFMVEVVKVTLPLTNFLGDYVEGNITNFFVFLSFRILMTMKVSNPLVHPEPKSRPLRKSLSIVMSQKWKR